MDTEKLIQIIRKIAKSSYWQTLFATSKDTRLNLFKNRINYTYLQILFMNYLNFYSSINLDIAMGDIEEVILKDDIYEDAYIYYKNKTRGKIDEMKKPLNIPNYSGNKITETTKNSWVFKRPRKI